MEFLNPQERFLIALIFYSPAIIAFVFGTVIGSLSNVIIFRMVYYKSIWSPPSHCTSCGTEIPWYLNMPLISYLVLRGRCKSCGARFTSRYFWVELISGLLYALVVLWVYTLPVPEGLGLRFWDIMTFTFPENPNLGFHPELTGMLMMFKGFVFITLLIILSMIDLEHRLLPDRLTIPGIVLGLLLSVAAPLNRPELLSLGTHGVLDAVLQSVIGMIVGGGILLIIAMIMPAGMGVGDIKLLAMIGAFVGVKALVPGIFIGFVVGGVAGAIVMIVGSIQNAMNKNGVKKYVPFKTYIPFGPFLALGGLIGFFWGWQILAWYMGFIAAGSSAARVSWVPRAALGGGGE
jgi:leader peptidase (prepilin peptidase) / N-methyltransferase